MKDLKYMMTAICISDFGYMLISITFPEETSPYYWKKMQEEAALCALISFYVLQQFSPVRRHAESCGASLSFPQSLSQT